MRSASANTASMSCSISSMPQRCFRPRRRLTMRWLSSGPTPAIGSSSSKSLGSPPSAMAISSWRCSPWLRAEAGVVARASRPTAARPRRAASVRLVSRRTSARKRKEWPRWACWASATFSSALKSRSTEVIWNERASPSCTRAWIGRRVTSRPRKRMVPESAARPPVSWLTSVVLPAPLGPIRAWISPCFTSIDTLSVASSPPKRFTSRSVTSRASVMAEAQQRGDAALGVERDDHQQGAEHDLPVFAPALVQEVEAGLERFLQHEEGERAVQRPESHADAAQHDHHDQVARLHPRHHGRRDVGAFVGEEDATEAAERAGDQAGGQAVAENREAQRGHAALVRLGAAQHMAERRMGEAAAEPQGGAKQGEAQPVERRLVAQVDQAGEAAAADVEPVVAAIGLEAGAEVIDQLREGERDHDEVDAARPERQRRHQRGPQRCRQQRDRPLHPAALDLVGRQDADRVAADADEGGMAEAHQPAIAQDHVQAD